MARKSGRFERYNVVGFKHTTMDSLIDICSGSEIESLGNPTESVISLIELQSVDGENIVLRPMTRLLLYNGQGPTLRRIVEQGSAYVSGGYSGSLVGGEGWNVVAVPDEKSAEYFSDNMSELTYNIFNPKSFLQRIEILAGLRSFPDWDKIHSNAVTGLSKEFEDIGFEGTEDYLDFVDMFPEKPFKTDIVEMKGHSKMCVIIGDDVFELEFDGRPSEGNHVPTQLADEIGVGVPENLVGESIVVGSGQYELKTTDYKVLGRNNSGSVSIGVR